ncbi:hypothetical protein [Mycolicibacterium sp. F2034L]|jgi:hypothetical protein|uniref:hypothetical protein n=1 Tax=Mycolicibacterium sp. F2034L TaxID=2926422 RepID=UPI001FF19F64|nr:hypothetical protein [Mycolicibacterium sp. F2034L]MCK0176848.1 hypothetical protein [Mycolicibacterium sp. F2034L]
MKRLAAAGTVALCAALLTPPGPASAAANTAVSSIPVAPGTSIEMHVTADCAGTTCRFDTTANLLTPTGPTGFPGDAWSRQTITLRSNDRDVWQEAEYSAPSGTPREVKGANHNNVLSKMYKSLRDVEISVTSFGGGPIERYRVDGQSAPLEWTTGRPATEAAFFVCSHIQVVYSGVNLTTPDACAQTTFG